MVRLTVRIPHYAAQLSQVADTSTDPLTGVDFAPPVIPDGSQVEREKSPVDGAHSGMLGASRNEDG